MTAPVVDPKFTDADVTRLVRTAAYFEFKAKTTRDADSSLESWRISEELHAITKKVEAAKKMQDAAQ